MSSEREGAYSMTTCILLTLLCFLTLTTSASAKCSWVLWTKIDVYSDGKGSAATLSPDIALENKTECEAALTKQWQRTREQWIRAGGERRVNPDSSVSEVSSSPGLVEIRLTGQAGNLLQKTTYTHQCWPATVDPRGLKGK